MPKKKGVEHWKAKLNPDKVREIRRLRAEGETYESIWLRFPEIANISTIQAVIYGTTWRHVE